MRRTKKVIDLFAWKAKRDAGSEESLLLTPLSFDDDTVMRQEDEERPVVVVTSPGVGFTLTRQEARRMAERLLHAAKHRNRRST